jgi:MraZ protein
VGQSGLKWGHVEPDRDGEVPPTTPSQVPDPLFEGDLWDLAFLGQFEYTLDAKNRLTIPPKFRGALSDGVVLAKDIDTCVSIWPMAGWVAHTDRILADRDLLDEDIRDYQRLLHSGAYEAQLDGAGRIMLPQPLIDRVGLEREVSLIGNLNVIEVWDRALWGKRQPELDAQAGEIARRLSRREKDRR